MFSVSDPSTIKPLSCHRWEFSELNKHQFRFGFSNMIDQLCVYVCVCPCVWGTEFETTKHFFLLCHSFFIQRSEIFHKLTLTDPNVSNLKIKINLSVFYLNQPKKLIRLIKMWFYVFIYVNSRELFKKPPILHPWNQLQTFTYINFCICIIILFLNYCRFNILFCCIVFILGAWPNLNVEILFYYLYLC